MREVKLYFSKEKNLEDYGFIFFLLGIFFLPSTMVIGVLFLLPAFLIASLSRNKSFFKDYWNLPFLIFGLLILLSAISQNYLLTNNYYEIWDSKLSLIGLANWMPFIWVFWASQPYLNSESKRRSFSLILVAGTFPVLITGFGQYFLNWNGPFETLNGLIIWYQRPIETPGGLSGLFSSQNYAASWLNFVWPFCIALFFENGQFIQPQNYGNNNLLEEDDYDVEYVIIPNWSLNVYTGYPVFKAASFEEFNEDNPIIGVSVGSPFGIFAGDFFMNVIAEFLYYNFQQKNDQKTLKI